ncbi:MAG: glucokinase, partial [Pseudomonadota bacterium]
VLFWDGVRHLPIATEGGHCDFAPNDEREDALLLYLRKRYRGHVSYERILSGPGLYNIYCFLRDSEFAPVSVDPDAQEGDPSAVISRLALEGRDPLCMEALRMFARIYGAEAGNLALKCLSAGGVRIGGGIAPKILPVLQQGEFMRGFLDKGRFEGMLKKMSVKVALYPKAPLLGAAYYAEGRVN